MRPLLTITCRARISKFHKTMDIKETARQGEDKYYIRVITTPNVCDFISNSFIQTFMGRRIGLHL